jgi:hypothetical protein
MAQRGFLVSLNKKKSFRKNLQVIKLPTLFSVGIFIVVLEICVMRIAGIKI